MLKFTNRWTSDNYNDFPEWHLIDFPSIGSIEHMQLFCHNLMGAHKPKQKTWISASVELAAFKSQLNPTRNKNKMAIVCLIYVFAVAIQSVPLTPFISLKINCPK